MYRGTRDSTLFELEFIDSSDSVLASSLLSSELVVVFGSVFVDCSVHGVLVASGLVVVSGSVFVDCSVVHGVLVVSGLVVVSGSVLVSGCSVVVLGVVGSGSLGTANTTTFKNMPQLGNPIPSTTIDEVPMLPLIGIIFTTFGFKLTTLKYEIT